MGESPVELEEAGAAVKGSEVANCGSTPLRLKLQHGYVAGNDRVILEVVKADEHHSPASYPAHPPGMDPTNIKQSAISVSSPVHCEDRRGK